MTPGKRRDSGKERYWRRMLTLWRAGDLSIRAFCQQHQLSEPNFYQWRRIICERDRERPPPGKSKRPSARPTRRQPVTATPLFVPLEVSLPQGDHLPGALELVLPRVLVLRVYPGFDAATLRQLLKALEDPPC